MGSVSISARSAFLITAAAGAMLGVPSPTFAQDGAAVEDTAAKDEGGLDVIVVQARKVSENLQDVPVAVTAFSGGDLSKLNVQQIEDLAKYTPGMSMSSGAATPSAPVIVLRGQVQTDILATVDPSVGTYVDGVYWARAYGVNANPLDVQSAQVLKGPQGTLFGRNTTGGAILINTNDPDLQDFGLKASISYGRFNEFEATGVINLPIVKDRIALRLAGSRVSRDGYTRNIAPSSARTAILPTTNLPHGPYPGPHTGEKYDNRDRWNGRAKLLVRPTDTLELLFSGEYYDASESTGARYLSYVPDKFTGTERSNYDIANTASLLVGILNGRPMATAAADGQVILDGIAAELAKSPRNATMNERPHTTARTKTFGFTGTLEVPWGEAKLITGYRKVKSSSLLDVDGSPYQLYATANSQNLSQYSMELQTTGKMLHDAVDFAGGLFYFREHGSDIYLASILVPLLPYDQNSAGYIKNSSMGLYGQGTWHITDKLGLTAGVRYSVDDKGLTSRNADYFRATGVTQCRLVPVSYISPVEDLAPDACVKSKKGSFSGWSYTLGLDYKFNDNTMVYAKTSKGFRAGGENFRARTLSAFRTFQPERAFSYEAGVKTELLDRRVRFNLAAYLTDVKDIQRTAIAAVPPIPPSTVGSASTFLGNAGTARFKGFEAELAVRPVNGLTLSGNAAYVDATYRKFGDLSGDRRHERFEGVAKWQYAVAADYAMDVSTDIGLNFHADYAWRDDVASNSYNYPTNPHNDEVVAGTTVPAMGLLGAQVAMKWRNYEFAVYGRNLTNERKFNGQLAVLPLGWVASWRQEPATYGVSAKVEF